MSKKDKSLLIIGAVICLSVASTMTAFAGWEQTGASWKYKDNSQGIYLTGWQWLDGNNDNIAECYYLDSTGVMVSNTVIEGYTINDLGQWTVNGVVQTEKDLPTLSTGKTFDEMSAMRYDIAYNTWATSSDEEKIALGKEGLIGIIGGLGDFTEQEIEEVADYILSKSPLPVVESKPAPQPTQSQNQTQSKPKETQASVQPTQPQPVESALPPEVQAEIDRRGAEREAKLKAWEAEHGHPIDNYVDPNEWEADGSRKDVEINIGGGN